MVENVEKGESILFLQDTTRRPVREVKGKTKMEIASVGIMESLVKTQGTNESFQRLVR